jgi:hypothetical protein
MPVTHKNSSSDEDEEGRSDEEAVRCCAIKFLISVPDDQQAYIIRHLPLKY